LLLESYFVPVDIEKKKRLTSSEYYQHFFPHKKFTKPDIFLGTTLALASHFLISKQVMEKLSISF